MLTHPVNTLILYQHTLILSTLSHSILPLPLLTPLTPSYFPPLLLSPPSPPSYFPPLTPLLPPCTRLFQAAAAVHRSRRPSLHSVRLRLVGQSVSLQSVTPTALHCYQHCYQHFKPIICHVLYHTLSHPYLALTISNLPSRYHTPYRPTTHPPPCLPLTYPLTHPLPSLSP